MSRGDYVRGGAFVQGGFCPFPGRVGHWAACPHLRGCVGRHPANRNEMRVSGSDSYALLFLFLMYMCGYTAAVQTASTEVLQGSALRLNCSAYPSGCATVDRSTTATWYFSGEANLEPPGDPGSSVTVVTPHDQDPNSEYLVTRSNDLVVLSVNTSHSGVYTCLIDGRTVARHRVRVLRTYHVMEVGTRNFEITSLCPIGLHTADADATRLSCRVESRRRCVGLCPIEFAASSQRIWSKNSICQSADG